MSGYKVGGEPCCSAFISVVVSRVAFSVLMSQIAEYNDDVLQGDSLERGPAYSVVAPVRMKQSEPQKYSTYLDGCVIYCITCSAGSDLCFLPDTCTGVNTWKLHPEVANVAMAVRRLPRRSGAGESWLVGSSIY